MQLIAIPDRWMHSFFRLRTQLLFLALASILFFVVYESLLAGNVGGIIARNKVPADRIYYEGIFGNIPGASLAFAGILVLAVLFYKQLRSAILWFEGRPKLFLATCGMILVAVQITTMLSVRSIPYDDSLAYLKLSDTLFNHHAYVNDAGLPTSYWPVGYPAYLMSLKVFIGNTIAAARVMNVVIALALVVTLFAVFKSWLSDREQLVFILVTALFPNLVLSSNVILSDYLFTLFLWIAVWIYLRRKHSIASFAAMGLVLAVMSYLRPVALLLPLVVVAALWWGGEWKACRYAALAGLLVFVVVLAPWTVRNYRVFGAFVPISTNGGYNFRMGSHPGASGGVNHDFDYNVANPDEAEESANAFKAGEEEIFHHPLQTIVRMPKKIFELYRRGDSSLSWAFKRTEKPLNPFLLSFLFYATNASSYFVVYLGLVTILGCFVFRKTLAIHPLLVILYLYVILVTLVFVGSERYLIPVLPVHQFLAAKFLSSGAKS